MSEKRVLIVGAGFAGVECAKRLRRGLGAEYEVVLFSRDNHMVFQPLLPDVAGSSLNPRAIAPPLRLLLPGVVFRNNEVLEIDSANRCVHFEAHDGTRAEMHYSHLVLACGNVVNLALLPGMADHALPLKTIGDAIAIRAHVMRQLERADSATDSATRRRYLSVIVIGGGFSGVEIAGELNDLFHSLRRYYPAIGADDIQVTLLHSQAEILPEVNPKLRRFAQTKMSAAGISLRLNARAAEVTRHGVVLSDGQRIEGSTVICTVGSAANPVLARSTLAKERGRLRCEADLRVQGETDVWAIGDCALAINAFDQQPTPPTAQFAERMGRQCAENLLRLLRGEPTLPFRFRPIGSACGIGGRRGVAEIYGRRFSGLLAFALWRSTFLLKIPSLAQKLKVGLDWTWELIFPRDLSHFRSQRSDPIGRAHFAAGETILQRHDALRELYALEQGEAALVSIDDHGDVREWFRLAPGALIGEASFADIDAGRDRVEVRALTGCDVLIMGKHALGTLSRALQPLQSLLERAVDRPKLRIWQHHQTAMQGLANVRVNALPGARPPLCFDHRASLGQSYGDLIERKEGCLLVTEHGRLIGIATRTDLLAALARGADRGTPIGQAMNRHVQSIHTDASAAQAAELMADGGLKYLPMVDSSGIPTGLLRSDEFVRFALARER